MCVHKRSSLRLDMCPLPMSDSLRNGTDYKSWRRAERWLAIHNFTSEGNEFLGHNALPRLGGRVAGRLRLGRASRGRAALSIAACGVDCVRARLTSVRFLFRHLPVRGSGHSHCYGTWYRHCQLAGSVGAVRPSDAQPKGAVVTPPHQQSRRVVGRAVGTGHS